jgi:subfamily B ATP-binding cassette protein MsbA
MNKKNNGQENNQSWANLKQIYSLMFHYWVYVIGGVFTMLLFAAMNGVSITLIAPILDVVFKSKHSMISYHTWGEFYPAFFSRTERFISGEIDLTNLQHTPGAVYIEDLKSIIAQTDPILMLWVVSLLVIFMFVLKNIFYYTNRFFFVNLRGRTVRDIRNLMYKKYLSQSLAFFNVNRVGDSLVRMVNDVDIVSQEFISNLFSCLRDLLVMLSCIVVAYIMNPRLFLISMLVTPIFVISISYIGKKIKKYSKRIQAQYSSMFSNVEEALSSMRIVKAYSKEDYELGVFKGINDRYRRLWQRVEMYNGFNIPISEISSALIGAVLVLVAGHDMLKPGSAFTIGKFTAFLIAIFATLHPMKTLTQAYANLKKAIVSLERISFILSRQSEILEISDPVTKTSFEDSIELKNVGFSYNNDKKVLSNVSFSIKKGEKVALIGSSGSGKTTLVNMLNRMYDLTEGEILIDGIPISRLKISNLRSLFGVVTQESILFSNTIAYNIQYGNETSLPSAEIKAACDVANATEFIEQFPLGFDQPLQTKASDLSGGQKQRLCIARAIAANPPILIFDEATSALDTDSERKVQKAIDQATENRTVIVIAHRLSTILGADKIVVLEKGQVLDIGRHEELINRCERYQDLYNIQFAPGHSG